MKKYEAPISWLEWERDGGGWFVPKGSYGVIRSAVAELVIDSRCAAVSVGIGIGFDGYYAARLAPAAEAGRETDYILTLERKDDIDLPLADCFLSECGKSIRPGEPFSLGISRKDHTLFAYLNGQLLMEAQDPWGPLPTRGRAGVRFTPEHCCEIRAFRFEGEALPEPARHAQTPVPCRFETDFSRDGDEKYWLQSRDAAPWQLKETEDGRVFGCRYAEKYSESWLHVFEEDPTVHCVFKAIPGTEGGCFGLFVRSSPETAYLKAGYDFSRRRWYMASTDSETDKTIQTLYQSRECALSPDEWHRLDLETRGRSVCLCLDGMPVLRTDAAEHTGVGRLGVYARECGVLLKYFACELPFGLPPQPGVTAYTPVLEKNAASMEVEDLGNGTLLGLTKVGLMLSEDDGMSFRALPGENPYRGTDPQGQYQSVLHREDGTFLQTRLPAFEVLSSDDCVHWEHVGCVVPDGEKRNGLFHTAAMREITLPDGGKRLFLPISWRVNLRPGDSYADTWKIWQPDTGKVSTGDRRHPRQKNAKRPQGHFTEYYYSDDGGRNWKKSETTSRDLLPVRPALMDAYSWAEPKVIQCPDGTLCSCYSRSRMGCVQYILSHDSGVTWQGPFPIPQMQCAGSSYAIEKDPYEKNTWYLVWVNSAPLERGNLQGRFRVSLARSHDGIHWKFLADLERVPVCYSDFAASHSPLFHIVDPSVTVMKDYLLVTFGRSSRSEASENGLWQYHHSQRVRVVRAEKQYLTEKSWDAATVTDLTFPQRVRIRQLPRKTVYRVNEPLSLEGGLAEETLLNGETVRKPMDALMMPVPPDMTVPGEKTVRLYEPDGYFHCEFTIEVR